MLMAVGLLSAGRTYCRATEQRDRVLSTRTTYVGRSSGLLVADFSRILAGPYATMLLADLGAEVIKVEGPGGDDTRTWLPPTRDGVATYYLGVNRNKRSVALDLKDADDARLAQRAGPAGRRHDRELPARRPAPFRARLRDRGAGQSQDRLRLDLRLRQRREGRGAARLRPDRPGDLRPDEPDRRPRRSALSGRDLGVRRDGRAARHDRHSRRAAQAATRPGAASTSRSTCMSSALSGPGEPRPARSSRAASSRSGWGTPTRACSRTSRCPAPTAT